MRLVRQILYLDNIHLRKSGSTIQPLIEAGYVQKCVVRSGQIRVSITADDEVEITIVSDGLDHYLVSVLTTVASSSALNKHLPHQPPHSVRVSHHLQDDPRMHL